MFTECPDPPDRSAPPFHTRPVICVLPPPQQPLTPSRRLFEQWAIGDIRLPHIWDGRTDAGGLERAPWNPDAYEVDTIQRLWIGWQAAIELAKTSNPSAAP